jgi:hypothetical protein
VHRQPDDEQARDRCLLDPQFAGRACRDHH